MYQQPAEKEEVDIFAMLEQKNKDRDRDDRQGRGIIMEPRYYKEDYNKQYTIPDDLSRIVKGTFDISRYFREGEFFAQGPWRVSALEKALKNPKSKLFAEQLSKKGFDYVCSNMTADEGFESIAESCRREWNEMFGGTTYIETYEQAFLYALAVLKKIKPNLADPFDNRRVEVLFDEKAGVYIVKKTFDMRPFHQAHGGGFYLIAFDVNGQVLSFPGAFRQ